MSTPVALDRNEFLFEHPEAVRSAISQAPDLSHYAPPSLRHDFNRELAAFLSVKAQSLTLGHGAEDLLFRLLLLHRMKRNTVVMPELSWGEYDRMASSIGYSITKTAMARLPSQIAPRLVIDLEALAERLARGDQRRMVVLLPTTNNPTGSRLATSDLSGLVEQFPQTLFILDAVYEGLPGDLFSRLGQLRNVHVLGSLSKFFGLPGLRLGFATGSLPAAFSMALGHGAWALNAGRAALRCASYYQDIRVGLTAAAADLAGLGLVSLNVYASEAPFVLVDAGPADCAESYVELQRDCESAAQVRPKYFVHQQHLWMRFGLGPEAIVARVAQFLRLWDSGQNSIRPPLLGLEDTLTPRNGREQVLPETRRREQLL